MNVANIPSLGLLIRVVDSETLDENKSWNRSPNFFYPTSTSEKYSSVIFQYTFCLFLTAIVGIVGIQELESTSKKF